MFTRHLIADLAVNPSLNTPDALINHWLNVGWLEGRKIQK